MNASTLPKKSPALKDCRMFVTVNLGTKKLEEVKAINEQPISLGILLAEKFEMTSKFTTSSDTKQYFPKSSVLSIQSKFLGAPVTIQTMTEYSNYTKK